MYGTPLVWPCTACGRYNAASLVKCLNCGAVRTGQRAEPAKDGVPEPPLATEAERQRANAAARRILALVGDLGEPS